ncbi:MAG: hypothetical protein JNK85_05880 [Verrucomicrobiales bacterium]|nr:hypothetical protein [Verrucomicrobiales bacterium]
MNVDLVTWGLFTGRLAIATLLLVGLAAGVARFVGSPSSRRSIWQSALLAIATLWAAEVLDLRPRWPIEARHRVAAGQASRVEVRSAPTLVPPATPPSVTDVPPATANEKSGSGSGAGSGSPTEPAPNPPAFWPGALWLVGTLFVLGSILFRRVRLILWMRSLRRREARDSEDAVSSGGGEFTALRDRLGQSSVRILVTSEVAGPVAFGIWKPTVALPTDFTNRFSPQQCEAMVAHELVHLKQHDPAWCLVADLLCAIAWWHPAVWWTRSRFRAAAESAADAAAATKIAGGHVALAEALVALGRDLVSAPGLRGLGVVGSGFRSQLAHRVVQLLDAQDVEVTGSPSRFRSWPVAGAMLAAAWVCLATPWPAAPALGLRNALQATLPAAVHSPGVSATEVRRMAPATLSSLLQDPQFRSVAASLEHTGATADATATPANSAGHPTVATTGTTATDRPITLEVKFAEITERSGDDLGLDWLFGQSPTNNAPLVTGSATNLPAQDDSPTGRGLRVDLLRTEGQAVRLGAGQFAALLDRLEGRGGMELLAAPKVTTVSGREARIEIKEARTLVTDVKVVQPTPTNTAPFVNYQTEKLFVGQSVEVVPRLAGDVVQLKITASVTEFLGYDAPQKPSAVTAPGAAPFTYQEPLPRVRVRQTVADGIAGAQQAIAGPGETIVLRGPLVTETQRTVDKVAVLGDVPLLGRLFRHSSTQSVRKRLYIFVSPVVNGVP